jgi:hypothetical protein
MEDDMANSTANQWVIERPAGGIGLNAGHPEVLRQGEKVLTFATKKAAVDFLVDNKVVASEAALADSTIKVVRQ